MKIVKNHSAHVLLRFLYKFDILFTQPRIYYTKLFAKAILRLGKRYSIRYQIHCTIHIYSSHLI